MRTSNSIKNVIIAGLMNIITIIVGLVTQKIFVMQLGEEYLGINGLFSNVISMLAIVELGFGSAIIYHLYEPLSNKDEEKVTILINYYKKVYRTIAMIIFALGLLVMPFLDYLIGEINIKENIYLLFFLALLDIIVSYLLAYKRSILYADQKTYITNLIHIAYVILLNVVEVIVLFLTQNYILYLIMKIIFRILENIVITIIANKKYPYITKDINKTLNSETKKDIHTKVKGLLFHRIAGSLVLGTDNLIISKIFGVITVGLYSNYNMIINLLSNLLGQIFDSLTASIGNLLVEHNKEKSYSIYKSMLLFNSWIYCYTGACILFLMDPFIRVWLGDKFVLPEIVLIILVLNYYIQGMRKTNAKFKEAAGIFYEDRFVPLLESAINIIASIIFAKLFGLSGVFLGTIVSSMALFLFSYPIYVYKRLFNRTYWQFLIEHIKYMCITILSIFITYLLIKTLNTSNLIIQLIVNLLICTVTINIIYFIVFRKTDEFKYYINIINSLLKKCKNKVNE